MKKLITYILTATIMSSCTSMNKGSSTTATNKENKSPSLTIPKVNKVWVPEKIEGDKFIEGHWMWVLERTTTWSQ